MTVSWPLSPVVLLSVLATGCYDGSALVKEARSAAMRTRLAEVDMGTYRMTLPRDPATNSFTELDMHIFGTANWYHVGAVESQLKSEDYRLRHAMLAAVRSAPAEELTEPNLARLRARIERVVNGVLENSPIHSVGFYSMRLYFR